MEAGVHQPPGSEHEMRSLTEVEDGETSPEKLSFPYQGDVLEHLNHESYDTIKTLWIACQEPDLSSLPSEILEKDTLVKIVEVVDKNEMNIFHTLFFNPENQWSRWFVKRLDNTATTKVVAFIEAICENIPKKDILTMMTKKDNINRTPLHYAAIIDETHESKIILAFLKYGADKALFVKDKNGETPVSFIPTSILQAHLDTKFRTEGPYRHKDQIAHCDVSILQPMDEADSKKTNSLNFEFLHILAEKDKQLLEHPVVVAILW